MPFLLGILFLVEWLGRNKECPLEVFKGPVLWRWLIYISFVALVFCFGASSESFIYFQF